MQRPRERQNLLWYLFLSFSARSLQAGVRPSGPEAARSLRTLRFKEGRRETGKLFNSQS